MSSTRIFVAFSAFVSMICSLAKKLREYICENLCADICAFVESAVCVCAPAEKAISAEKTAFAAKERLFSGQNRAGIRASPILIPRAGKHAQKISAHFICAPP